MNNTLTTRKAPAAAAVMVFAALALVGCGSPATTQGDAAPAPAAVDTAPVAAAPADPPFSKPVLPMADMFSTIQAPLMDNSAHFTGEVVSPASTSGDFVELFDKPGGSLIGGLSAGQTVPVVKHAVAPGPEGSGAPYGTPPTGGWLRVILPSRVSLPSTADAELRPHINEGTAWVWARDVKAVASKTHVFIDKATQRVTVGSVTGALYASFPASIGANVPTGPTFVATSSASESTCSGGPSILVSAQGTNADGFQGQSVNPVFIMGLGDDCFSGPTGMTSALPNVIRMSPADSKQLAMFAAAPGTPIDIIASGPITAQS